MSERLDKIERRLDTIESVLVSLAGWVHGPWGPLRINRTTDSPHDRRSTSPFRAIAHLLRSPSK